MNAGDDVHFNCPTMTKRDPLWCSANVGNVAGDKIVSIYYGDTIIYDHETTADTWNITGDPNTGESENTFILQSPEKGKKLVVCAEVTETSNLCTLANGRGLSVQCGGKYKISTANLWQAVGRASTGELAHHKTGNSHDAHDFGPSCETRGRHDAITGPGGVSRWIDGKRHACFSYLLEP